MNSYRVPGPPTHAIPHIHLSLIALIAAALMAVGLPGIAAVEISVDDHDLRVPLGTRVADAIEAGMVAPEPGDLVDDEGAVLVAGAGEPGVVLLNDSYARGSERLSDGDRLHVIHGADVIEGHLFEREPISIPVVYEGDGPLVAVSSPGNVGIREVVYGEHSGREIERRVVREAEPMVFRRFAPDPGERVVALTFDDGPWPLHTQQVLEILAREEVKATFFVVGKQVRLRRDLVRRMAEEGHQVGNHSLSHVYLRGASPELARSEIENAQAEIEVTIGERPAWYRPAGGVVSPAVWAQTRESKVRLITWTVDPQDYRSTSPVVLAQRVIESVQPGSVVLLHDGGGNRTVTVKALTTIIRELKSQGYEFVTVEELFD